MMPWSWRNKTQGGELTLPLTVNADTGIELLAAVHRLKNAISMMEDQLLPNDILMQVQ
jgi:hypothetical protein